MNYMSPHCELCGAKDAAKQREKILFYQSKTDSKAQAFNPLDVTLVGAEEQFHFSFAACDSCRHQFKDKSWQETYNAHVPHAVAQALEKLNDPK